MIVISSLASAKIIRNNRQHFIIMKNTETISLAYQIPFQIPKCYKNLSENPPITFLKDQTNSYLNTMYIHFVVRKQ